MGVGISEGSGHQPMLPGRPRGTDKSDFPNRTHLVVRCLQIATFY
jgi:hypothetical protein